MIQEFNKLNNMQIDDLTETCLTSESIYKGSVISLRNDQVKLPNEQISNRLVVEHSGGVVIVPITRDNKFVLVEQFRYAIGHNLLEFPAGRLNRNENPEKAALRELREETGFICNTIKFLGSIYTAPGFCEEKLHIYLATDLDESETDMDEDEFVKTVFLSMEELRSKIYNAEIYDAKTIAGWALIQNL